MALNGEPDRRPVRITVPQTWYHAAAEGALGALVAHQRRVATGEAQFVDVSVQAAVFWTGLNAMIAHAIQGRDIERNGTVLQLSTLTTPLVLPVRRRRGRAHRHVGARSSAGAVDGRERRRDRRVGGAGGLGDLRGADADGRRRSSIPLEEVRERSPRSLRGTRKVELFEGGIARDVTLAPVNTVADVLAMEHLAAREYWDERGAAERADAARRRRVRQVDGHAGGVDPTGARRRRAHRRGARRAAPPIVTAAHAGRPSRRAAASRWRASRSPTSRGSASGRSRPRRWPTTAPPSCTSRATRRPTGCASSARSRTTSRASTAASSSARSTRPSCRCS